ncbi:hypothetical protein L1987_10917 [Smallanthus sonchifolius]|uniref:Uncharacterized protein n=1 Tax=Smallanthus sonchifolius TaxID=185202 RepID=A0ACB9JBQ6_9ASTR|nr:hypothetical protein L1987_10917 [Smallanthus sonchifolius]
MLHCIRHQCRSLLRRPFTPSNPSILILTKSSSLTSAQALQLEHEASSSAANASIPYNIIQLFKQLRGSGLKSDGVKNRFRTLVSGLKSSQVDEIIDYLRTDDPDSAVEVFELLKNEYDFKHSRISRFVIAHVLAGQRRLKLLRSIFMQMLQEEGSGSGPSLCELL